MAQLTRRRRISDEVDQDVVSRLLSRLRPVNQAQEVQQIPVTRQDYQPGADLKASYTPPAVVTNDNVVDFPPLRRIADIPVTDSLPVEGVRPDAMQAILDAPLTRPRTVTQPTAEIPPPVRRLLDASQSIPLETDTAINTIEPLRRPISSYALEPSAYKPTDMVAPMPAGDVSLQRPRLTVPVDPLSAELENATALRRMPIDYGEEKGVQRQHAKRGFWGRLGAGLKRGGLGLLQGGIPGGVAGMVEGSIDPDVNARTRRQREIQQQDQVLNQELGRRKIQTDIEGDQARIDEIRRKPQVEQAKLERDALKTAQSRVLRNLALRRGQKLDPNNPVDAALLQDAAEARVRIDPDEWNNASNNEAVLELVDPENPTQTRRVIYNKATGTQTVLGQSGYVQPVDASGMTPAQKANQDIQRQGLGLRREGLGIQREGLRLRQEKAAGTTEVTPQQAAKERAAAQRLLNQERAYRTRAASAKTQEAADELNATADQFREDALTQYPDYVEEEKQGEGMFGGRVGSAPTRVRVKGGTPARTTTAPTRTSLPKLTEAQVRAAAIEKNLDPDKAVAKARSRGQL